MITPSILFANIENKGNERCFYCNAFCDTTYNKKDYISENFTNRDIVFRPASNYVCGGCVESFNEKAEIVMPDGELRVGNVRAYSWVIEQGKKQAYSKAYIKELREIVLNPPNPPFAIILSDSGKKHLIYRSRVNNSRQSLFVSLEEQVYQIEVSQFKILMERLSKIIACIGKIAVLEELNSMQAFLINEFWGDNFKKVIEDFNECKKDKNYKLAVWLSPNKEDCKLLWQEQ